MDKEQLITSQQLEDLGIATTTLGKLGLDPDKTSDPENIRKIKTL